MLLIATLKAMVEKALVLPPFVACPHAPASKQARMQISSNKHKHMLHLLEPGIAALRAALGGFLGDHMKLLVNLAVGSTPTARLQQRVLRWQACFDTSGIGQGLTA